MLRGNHVPYHPDTNSLANEHQAKQGYVHRQLIPIPVVADPDRVLNDQASSATLVTTVTSFLAQPDVPRNLTITPGGTTASVKAASIVITGKNIRDEVITESILMTENGTDLVAGVKAFKEITSIAIPAQDGSGATFDIGVGDVLGLDRCLDGNEVLLATLNGVYETTRPTVVADADEVEKNTIDINGTLDGAKNVVAVYMTKEIY
jgi:hypothetical protein